MKRLPKAPLTEEDRIIIESRWHLAAGRPIHPLWYVQWEADRCDAELMLALRQMVVGSTDLFPIPADTKRGHPLWLLSRAYLTGLNAVAVVNITKCR